MSPDNPFLQAVIDAPDDDLPRLVYADWLDDHDQPERAEFVRVQVELARGGWTPARRRELEARQRDLLMAHEAEWVAPLATVLRCRPGEWGGWVFRRGFAEYFRLPAAVLYRRGADLARLTPVRELLVERVASVSLTNLCQKPWLRTVTALYLPLDLRPSPAAVRALVECPYLGSLRRLHVSLFGLPDDDLRAMLDRFGDAVGPRS